VFHIVLYQPEIPPNTGNVIRLSANTGATLHLVLPLGFALDDAKLRRAGLDYHEWADVRVHATLAACLEICGADRVWAFSTRAARLFTDAEFRAGDVLLFGSETKGLPQSVLDGFPASRRLRLPMRAQARSLNLSNAVAVATYEAWRQLDFRGGQ
jgi:tRNA (cytidine/uridine-2'-O-)-methyltransferase